ncbi:lamin tail domain-containing protein, partial [Akkermansiaceae bacterium]|nr:lamin tail domain-containing protein [Akkermansiaceae bacterium]
MHLFFRAFSTASTAVLLTLIGLQSISADVIIPSSIKAFHQGDSLTGNGAALQIINGSGMSKPDPNDPSTWTINSTAWADDWQGFSTPSGNTTWAVLDLGSPTPNLDQIYLWNVQENNARDRGTNSFNIFHATSPTITPPTTSGNVTAYDFASGGWSKINGGFSLTQGTGNGDDGQSFDVSAAGGARYIGLQIISNHGGFRVGFAEVAFTTRIPTGAPSVVTLTPTTITSSSATIRGNLIEVGTSSPTMSLYWGPSDGGNSTAAWANTQNLGTQANPGEFSSSLIGLQPNTTYFYRAYGANAQGEDWASSSETFTTASAPPTVENLAASNIMGTSVTIGATVNSTGGEIPTLVIHYGDNDAGTGNWDSQLDLGLQTSSDSGNISDLTPGTTYFFRAAATNLAGTSWSPSTATFSTTEINPPTITNSSASRINGTLATLNGEVSDAGGDPPTVTIYYGTIDGESTPENWQLSVPGGIRTGSFSRLVSNLQPTTKYYFRAFAQNAAGSNWASISQTFTTPVFTPPSVVINEIHYDEDNKTIRSEFIELFNPSNDSVDLSGYYFSSGIDFEFPAGTILPAGGYLVISENPATMLSRFGYSGALGPFANGSSLKNSGERITLRNPAGTTIDEVDFQLGFPWPTVGNGIGNPQVSPSIELTNPLLDNDLGGSWRASGFPAATSNSGGGGGPVNYIANTATWKYLDDGSNQGTSWRTSEFNDSSWSSGPAELGYGDFDEVTTVNSGPAGGRYATTYFRGSTNIPDPSTFVNFTISVTYDDAYAIYVNGTEVARHAGLTNNAPFDEYANNTVGNNANDTLTIPASVFVPGTNIIAVEIHQSSSGSSDISFALSLTGEISGGTQGSFTPTPGAANRSYATAVPPQVRQVDHLPKEPTSGQPVVVTAKISDPDGVGSVTLQYQVVNPGDYFSRYLKFNSNGTSNEDPRYEDPDEWRDVIMTDDGTGGDGLAFDSIFTVTLPGTLQTNRRLIRYRILASDTPGAEITVPYKDDPQPNFAYFIYDGTPDWSGSIRGGDTPVTYPGSLMSSIATYFLLSKNTWVDDSQFGGYGGSEYLWPGTMVYAGRVYDHIQYRPRGGVHRYQYGKNFWKFDFGRGQRFEARDRYGKKYSQPWDKLNFSSLVQQVNFNHRGEQGLFEGVGFKLFELSGVEACNTHYAQFYVIDQASPTGANQYEGDYYGLYLAIEQLDGQYLDEHDLPDGNLYKIEGHSGSSNNQGPTQVNNRSDVSSFISGYRNRTPTPQWWEDNLDIEKYLSYRTIVEGIHHYDIAGGKNYFYYHNPETSKFEVHPWDLDLTWANNMYGNGNHDFKSKVAQNPAFNTRYQNRVREIMDLLYNSDEGYKLIDEMVKDVWTPGAPSLVSADRRQWDNNPRINHPDRYYDVASDKDFGGMIQVLKNYLVSRGSWMERSLLTQNNSIPTTPVLTYSGAAGFPSNGLLFTSSNYSSATPFAAMEWRISEIYDPTVANYVPGDPYLYEIENPDTSGELTSFDSGYLFPTVSARPGQTYRVRVRHQDTAGRWSHWSESAEFMVSSPDISPFVDNLRITEVHYHPGPASATEQAMGWTDSDFEYLELQNIGITPIDMTDVRFTKGIDFDFSPGTMIEPGAFLLIVKNQPAFASRHGAGLPVAGEWKPDDKLSNGGENIKLSLGSGTAIIEFTYDDDAPWPTSPDGGGSSLTLSLPTETQPADHSDPLAWQASQQTGGTPGVTGPGTSNFELWARSIGLGAEASMTDDNDNDGMNNLLEYALDSDPMNDSSHRLPSGATELIEVDGVTARYLTLTFRRNLAASELTFTVELADDLTGWN